MMRRPRRASTGEMISSLAFFGAGLWLLSEAALAEGRRAGLLTLCALSSLAAAVRHPVARLVARMARRDE